MEHGKTISEESFKSWISEIRNAAIKKQELEDKLSFYNMKLLGCSGVSYDHVSVSPTNNIGNGKIVWLERIEEVTNELLELDSKLKAYSSLKFDLTEKEQLVLDLYYFKQHRGNVVARQMGVSGPRIGELRKIIFMKYKYVLERS